MTMTDAELINELKHRGYDVSSITKQLECEDSIHDWISYLETMVDDTFFNKEIVKAIYYVLDKGKYPFEEMDENISEIKNLVREEVTDFPVLNIYFKIKKKSDIKSIDLSKYHL